jgi:hypothetical protein
MNTAGPLEARNSDVRGGVYLSQESMTLLDIRGQTQLIFNLTP